jgi:two-component system cell cycle response regulator DivK
MNGPLVLIVEDNALNAELLRDILQQRGYRTAEATTAGEGMRLYATLQPDIVLMDVQLPDMSGIEAVGQMRQSPAARHVPMVAVTASAMKSDVEAIMGAGFDAFVAKPISIRSFLDQVESLLRNAGRGGDATPDGA